MEALGMIASVFIWIGDKIGLVGYEIWRRGKLLRRYVNRKAEQNNEVE
jgi:hypothetical protein